MLLDLPGLTGHTHHYEICIVFISHIFYYFYGSSQIGVNFDTKIVRIMQKLISYQLQAVLRASSHFRNSVEWRLNVISSQRQFKSVNNHEFCI